VTHQILSYLTPASLNTVRGVCRSLCASATSNHLWQAHCRSLWQSKVSLRECRDISPKQWTFSLASDGWFRAYAKTLQIAFTPWLQTEAELDDTLWVVFFKSTIVNDEWPLAWHALVECNAVTRVVSSIDGLPLNPSKYWVDDRPSFRVTGYPPNVPSRDHITWCRLMQHISVLMVSDAPEFLDGLLNLDASISAEIASALAHSKGPLLKKESETIVRLEQDKDQIYATRKLTNRERLSEILFTRAKLQHGFEVGICTIFF
ncbi:hypothetical protein DFH27DRAFT_487295, partial [Peziza echinospora]